MISLPMGRGNCGRSFSQHCLLFPLCIVLRAGYLGDRRRAKSHINLAGKRHVVSDLMQTIFIVWLQEPIAEASH